MDQTIFETFKAFFQSGTKSFLLPIFLLATVLFLLCYSQYKTWAKYSKIPGPIPLPLVGNLLEFVAYDIDVLRIICSILKRFNGTSMLWFGRNPLMLISDPEHLRVYYTNQTMIDRPEIVYPLLAEIMDRDSLFCANGDRWRKMRKMMMVSFHSTPTETFLKNFLVTQKKLTQSLHANADGSTFPCLSMVKIMLTNSILLNTTECQLPEEDVAEILEMADFFAHVCYVRECSLHLRNDWIFRLLPAGKKFRKYLVQVQNRMTELVDKTIVEMKRLADSGEQIPNLYIYNMFRKFGDEPLDVIKSELLNMIIAGMDTTVNSVCYTLLMFGLYPEVQERIYHEDREVMKSLAGNDLEVADLDKYEYLDRVIKETLRIFPIGPMIGRKLGEDTYFGEYLVPKGTDVIAVPYVTYRRADVFPDPFKFDPDRFLPENVEKRHPYAYNPFSAGPRGCPGNRYAAIGMKTILTAIVRDFVIKTHYSSLEEVISNVRAEVTITDKQQYPIRVLPRRVND